METPKEDRYFEKVSNFVLVSAKTAVEAMAKRVEEVGLKAFIFSAEINDEVGVALKKFGKKGKKTQPFWPPANQGLRLNKVEESAGGIFIWDSKRYKRD